MQKLFVIVIGWISRRLGTALAGAAVVIGASPEDANATTAFLTAAAVFGSELVLKWLRLKYLKITGKQAATAATLLLLCGLMGTGLTACRVARPVGSVLQKGAVCTAETGLIPAEALADAPLPGLIRYPLAPLAAIPAVAGVVVAVPLWFVGTSIGGQWDY